MVVELRSIYECILGSLPPRQKPVCSPSPLATGPTLSTAEYRLTDIPAYIYTYIMWCMIWGNSYIYIYMYLTLYCCIYIRHTLVEHGRVDSVYIITNGNNVNKSASRCFWSSHGPVWRRAFGHVTSKTCTLWIYWFEPQHWGIKLTRRPLLIPWPCGSSELIHSIGGSKCREGHFGSH
jgi:hypothetical protein